MIRISRNDKKGEEQSGDGAVEQEAEEEAPLILESTSGNMTKEMKAVSRKFCMRASPAATHTAGKENISLLFI